MTALLVIGCGVGLAAAWAVALGLAWRDMN
jgi:hypothetical protein